MNIDLEFAELHNPLFLAGTNLQMKLDPRNRTGLKLIYDRAEKELLVSYNGKTAIVPASNVASMTPVSELPTKEPATEPTKAAPVSAQVSTPQDHVFAGLGKGKKGKW